MEQFFKPTRRYQERMEFDDDDGPFERTEVELAVPVEEFLSYRWDWKDLCAFVSGGVMRKILWITKDAFLAIEENSFVFDYLSNRIAATMQAASGQEQMLILVQIDHPVVSLGEVAVFWRAVATSNSVKVRIDNDDRLRLPLGPDLSQFLPESPSLQVLEFVGFHFKEEHCRALATLERTDLEVTVTLRYCTIELKDAEDLFIEWFRQNRVVTELDCCGMDSNIICAICGNNYVKKLTIANFATRDFGKAEIPVLAQALMGNMGLEHLVFRDFVTSSKGWSLLFRSLSTHPRINFLSIHSLPYSPYFSAESKSIMMNAIIKMLYLNTVVHTIEFPSYQNENPDEFNNEEVYHNSILPRLEMNLTCFEEQRQAVRQADPSIRPQLLGRALHVVRYNPNLVFQFLSENVPAFVRTEEEDSTIPLQNDTALPWENDPVIVSGSKRKAPS
jgi:hypothetical protein